MRDTQWMVLLIGLLLLASASAQGADSARERETLRGLTGVRVLAAPLKPEIERHGLTKRQLQTEVERRLHKAGICVLTEPEQGGTPGWPSLAITVTTASHAQLPTVYALSMLVAVHQNTLLERDLSVAAYQAATWSVGTIAWWTGNSWAWHGKPCSSWWTASSASFRRSTPGRGDKVISSPVRS
jgi:hypothetical protein